MLVGTRSALFWVLEALNRYGTAQALSVYVKTVELGLPLEPSYVVERYLDAQRPWWLGGAWMRVWDWTLWKVLRLRVSCTRLLGCTWGTLHMTGGCEMSRYRWTNLLRHPGWMIWCQKRCLEVDINERRGLLRALLLQKALASW